MSFSALGLRPDLLRAVARQGYTDPTPVQREAIPLVLEGRDLLAGAQTGTGKTAAFVLPMLQRLAAESRNDRRVRALVLTPTRELAIQVEESVRVYSGGTARSTAIYGGVGFGGQVGALRRGAEIVVATPGRLLDHARQGTIDLRAVEILVLDEADRMLDMGFIRDIRQVLALLPDRRQNLLFSATFSREIRSLAEGLLDRPASVQVTPENTAVELVDQIVHPVDRERKRELLTHLVRTREIDQALVFTRTKHGANKLVEQLNRDGIAAAAIHGNKSQPQRVRALADFRAGRILLLVATEVAARGIDIEALPHVVNYELPMVPADYVHRIGRTGRAGVTGTAVSLVCVDEGPLLREIERLLKGPIRTSWFPASSRTARSARSRSACAPDSTAAGEESDTALRPTAVRRSAATGTRAEAVRAVETTADRDASPVPLRPGAASAIGPDGRRCRASAAADAPSRSHHPARPPARRSPHAPRPRACGRGGSR